MTYVKTRSKIAVVCGLGLVVAVSTALQTLQNQAAQREWRPYVLIAAVAAGVVAVWQLVASVLLVHAVPTDNSRLGPRDPRKVGPFRIVARLGIGSLGHVYLGVDSDGQYVAVKVIRPEFAESPEFRRRFAREVATVRQIHGPHTGELVAASAEADEPWLATSYVAGPSLQHAVEHYGPWSSESVWHLAGGIADALAAIHAVGVIHRDLKPANILITQDGPRIIDFGIARSADDSGLTGVDQRPGTPAYMSPEQAQGRAVSPAADVFALGMVLAFAATARTPFGDGGSDAVLYRVIHEPADLSGIDGDLRTLIELCLDKRPEARPTPEQIKARTAVRTVHEVGPGWLPAPVSADINERRDRVQRIRPQAPGADPPPRRRPWRWLTPITATLALIAAAVSIGIQVIAPPVDVRAEPPATTPATTTTTSSFSASATPSPIASPAPTVATPTRSNIPTLEAPRVTVDGAGPYRLGTTLSQHQAAGALTEVTPSSDPQCPGYTGAVGVGQWAFAHLYFAPDGTLDLIGVADPTVPTPSGATVGMTMSQLKSIYSGRGGEDLSDGTITGYLVTASSGRALIFGFDGGSATSTFLSVGTAARLRNVFVDWNGRFCAPASPGIGG